MGYAPTILEVVSGMAPMEQLDAPVSKVVAALEGLDEASVDAVFFFAGIQARERRMQETLRHLRALEATVRRISLDPEETRKA